MKKRWKKYLIRLTGKQLNMLYRFAPERAAQKSLNLFITPRRGRLQPEQRWFLETARHEKIKVNQQEIQAYCWPRGEEKVLLVHGWESNAARWEMLIGVFLKKNLTVIALDAPAHGDSDGETFGVPAYAEAVAELAKKYTPAIVIGHSLGGSTVMFQHYRSPLPGLKKMILLAPGSEMTHIVRDFQNQLELNENLIATFARHFEQKFHYSAAEFSMRKMTADFTHEALFIHDKEDRIVAWQDSEKLVEQWENARLILTKGYGHGLRQASVRDFMVDFITEK